MRWISREEVSQKSELTTIEEIIVAGTFSPCVVRYDHSCVGRVKDVRFSLGIKDLDDGAARSIAKSDACSHSSEPTGTSSNYTVDHVSFCICFLMNSRRVRLQNVAAHFRWRILPSRWCAEHLTVNDCCQELLDKNLWYLLILRRHPSQCENEDSFKGIYSIEDGEWS